MSTNKNLYHGGDIFDSINKTEYWKENGKTQKENRNRNIKNLG